MLSKIIQSCQKMWNNNITPACDRTRLDPIISFHEKEYPKETHAGAVYYTCTRNGFLCVDTVVVNEEQ